jgi:uncharacterized membrane protein HdeD (DUF308 family)
MTKTSKIETIIWGVFWIFIGLMLLIHNFYPDYRILQNIWKLWPVLIIIIGINIIIRFFHKNE